MTAEISILVPITVTGAVLVSSTATETYADYVATTTYAKGGRCISPVTHRIVESLRDANVGHDPSDTTNLTGSSPWWVDIAPANKWAMFDTDVSTATTSASPLRVVLRPGFLKDIYLGGIVADEIDVLVENGIGGEVIRSTHYVLEGSQPDDYDSYCFSPFRQQVDYIEGDLDAYSSAVVTVTLTRLGGPVSCAIMAVGNLVPLAQTLSGAKVAPKTLSYIEQDKYGGAKITRRGASNDLAISGLFNRVDDEVVHQALLAVLDVPCLVMASRNGNSPLRCFGLISGSIEYPPIEGKCMLNINVQGLIKWQ